MGNHQVEREGELKVGLITVPQGRDEDPATSFMTSYGHMRLGGKRWRTPTGSASFNLGQLSKQSGGRADSVASSFATEGDG